MKNKLINFIKDEKIKRNSSDQIGINLLNIDLENKEIEKTINDEVVISQNNESFSTINLIKKSFNFYRNNLIKLLSISVVLIVPVVLSYLSSNILFLRVISLLGIFLTTYLYLPLIFITHNISIGREASVGLVFKSSLLTFFSFFWISTLQMLIIFGSIVPLIIPGITVSILLIFANYSLVVEGKKGFDAILRSRHLVLGKILNIFGKVFVFIIFYMIITLVIVMILNIFIPENIASIITSIILLPFLITYFYYLFIPLTKERPLESFNPNDKRKTYKILAGWGVVANFLITTALIATIITTSMAIDK